MATQIRCLRFEASTHDSLVNLINHRFQSADDIVSIAEAWNEAGTRLHATVYYRVPHTELPDFEIHATQVKADFTIWHHSTWQRVIRVSSNVIYLRNGDTIPIQEQTFKVRIA